MGIDFSHIPFEQCRAMIACGLYVGNGSVLAVSPSDSVSARAREEVIDIVRCAMAEATNVSHDHDEALREACENVARPSQDEREAALGVMLSSGVRGDVTVAAAAIGVHARCFDMTVVRVLVQTLPIRDA